MNCGPLEKILNSVSNAMIQQFHETSVIRHNSGKGTAREQLVGDFLRKYTPRTTEVVTNAEIVNDQGHVSPQCDIVFIDHSASRPLLAEGGFHIVTAESALGVMEVKSRLTRPVLRDIFRKLQEAKLMERYISLDNLWTTTPWGTRVQAHAVPFNLVFAYECESLDTVYDEMVVLCEAAPNLRYCLDGVWVLSQGFVTWTDLEASGTEVGGPFYSNFRLDPASAASTADLVMVNTSEVLFPLVADLNYRLLNKDAYIRSILHYVRGGWGSIDRATAFEFDSPSPVIRSDEEELDVDR